VCLTCLESVNYLFYALKLPPFRTRYLRIRADSGVLPFTPIMSMSLGTMPRIPSVLNGIANRILRFRDRLSFRFLGVRYATQPKRFEYSQLYTGNGSEVSATYYGPMCFQGSVKGSEDCHFLNIYTPYLPGPRSRRKALKPVMVCSHVSKTH
jgi:hypothetical protein